MLSGEGYELAGCVTVAAVVVSLSSSSPRLGYWYSSSS
jgi:hypothetical protein